MAKQRDSLEIVRTILKTALEAYGLAKLTVAATTNEAGEPAIQATADYAPNARTLDAKVLLDAIVKAMQEISKLGDDRFVYVENLYSGGDLAIDAEDGDQHPKRRSAVRG